MDPHADDLQDRVQRLAAEHVARGDAVGWFERVYAEAAGDARGVPWAGMKPRPHFVEWADRVRLAGAGRRALVVGCGLGDDAVELARRGFAVLAFDVSPTAVEWCRGRFATEPVRWEVGDLFAPPAAWARAFAFVLEEHTVQALPPGRHAEAMGRIAGWLAPEGTLFVLARGRGEGESGEGPPWPLARSELAALTAAGLSEAAFEDRTDGEPPVRRFLAVYRAPR